jgi:hypothetical protein
MTATLENAGPEEAADLLTDVFAKGGVLDELTQVLATTRHLVVTRIPDSEWSERHPGYGLYHGLADTVEHLHDYAQELRGAPQVLRGLPDPAVPTTRPDSGTGGQARLAPSASPLPPPGAPPAPASPGRSC